MSDQSAERPATVDPPQPPIDEGAVTPADLVDAIEARVFAENGNPAEEVEEEPAEEKPAEEPPE